ncbi:MAG: zf-TFIIB domain-containing protein [Patescibacteria group bacterium]|nr:zf-TFIIB domain-containing protein [Patescibacteria group bacterium]
MKCPDCGKNLKEVLASARYGTKIKIDQCQNCGGIWFDDFELLPIPKEEVERIENVNVSKLQKKSLFKDSDNLCPKCLVKLKIFKDYNFPKQLEVEYCEKCDGLWMNRGEATDFKIWQEEKIARNKKVLTENKKVLTEEDKKFQEDIRILLASHKGDDFGVLGEVGKLLATRMDPRTLRPLDSGSGHARRGMTGTNKTALIIMNILYVLLRLFLRR